MTSVDEGQTWQYPGTFNVTLPAPFTGHLQPAVGHGLQISGGLCGSAQCKQAGRLIVPFVCNNNTAPSGHGDSGKCPTCQSCLFYSDDHGKSWQFGAYGQSGSRESQVSQQHILLYSRLDDRSRSSSLIPLMLPCTFQSGILALILDVECLPSPAMEAQTRQ